VISSSLIVDYTQQAIASDPIIPFPPATLAVDSIITNPASISQNSSSTSSTLTPQMQLMQAKPSQLSKDDSGILASIVNSNPLGFTFTNFRRVVRGVWNRIRESEVETMKVEATSFAKTPDVLGSEHTQLDIH